MWPVGAMSWVCLTYSIWGQALSSGAQCQDKRQWTQAGIQGVSPERQQIFFQCTGAGLLAWASQRLWSLLLEDLQKLPGRGPGSPALGVPAGAGVSQRSSEDSASLSHPVMTSLVTGNRRVHKDPPQVPIRY